MASKKGDSCSFTPRVHAPAPDACAAGSRRSTAELVPCRVVPATVEGADEVMPVGSMKMQRAATTIRFGEPFEVGPKGGKQALERAREQVASMLPMAMRPADGDVAFV